MCVCVWMRECVSEWASECVRVCVCVSQPASQLASQSRSMSMSEWVSDWVSEWVRVRESVSARERVTEGGNELPYPSKWGSLHDILLGLSVHVRYALCVKINFAFVRALCV